MALTSIGDQKTPGRPVEITFAAELGLPSANKELLLIGTKIDAGASSGSAVANTVVVVNNVADEKACSGEVATKFGNGSELAKMVLAAVRANRGGGTFPTIKCVPLPEGSVDFGVADAALVAAQNVKAEYVVSQFDATDQTLTGKLKDHCLLVSGAQRVENNQFGTIGVAANKSVTDPSTLFKYDTQFLSLAWFRKSDSAYSVGEIAAAYAARLASNGVPFNPVNDDTIVGLDAQSESQRISVGAGLESETCLGQGWTPIYTKPNNESAIVRSVTARLSVDGTGSPVVGAYYDVQDFDVLYFFRKTVFTRLSQPDFKKTKASAAVGNRIKSEIIRLAKLFETQGMFQAVDLLAPSFQIERSATDRHRFDIKIPVNVVPGLQVVATNIEAGTEFDTFSA